MNKTASVFALAATLGLATAGVASAADPIRPAPAPAGIDYVDPYVLGDVWTGFYAGAHLGGVWADNDIDDGKFLGGVQAGYNHQFGQFVLGAELSASYTDEFHYTLAPGASLSQDWSVTAAGRAGVAFENTLVYGTLGATWAELSPNGAVTSGSETHTGLSFGGGVEHQFGNGLAARVQYTQTRFFDVDTSVGGIGRTDTLVNHAVTAGLNFHF